MSHFIKEIDTESEEFEIFLNDEEYYAWITQDHDYIEFLKRTGQYIEEKKEIKKCL